MALRLTDEHVHQYYVQGYIVLKRIVPASLVGDLRRQVDKGRDIARRKDPNAQRIQPVKSHPELDLRPFRDFATLPGIVDAVKQLIGPEAWIDAPESGHIGVLLEPAERPWATSWHRDFGVNQRRVELEAFRKMQSDRQYFHQINCALFAEDCTWYVPGSHHRDDLPEETRLGTQFPWQIGMDQKDLSTEELERFCLDYVESMPRAIRLVLDAGDFALYRNHGWHLGNYVPYKRRATLHDNVWTPRWRASYERWAGGGAMEATSEEAVAKA
jgi:ectoine hydroxylase-related dioxygenase (phytanoyl-CoA dioxygenase family)